MEMFCSFSLLEIRFPTYTSVYVMPWLWTLRIKWTYGKSFQKRKCLEIKTLFRLEKEQNGCVYFCQVDIIQHVNYWMCVDSLSTLVFCRSSVGNLRGLNSKSDSSTGFKLTSKIALSPEFVAITLYK
jgi:hypothetical protein